MANKKQTAALSSGKLAGKAIAFLGKFGYGGRDLEETLLPLVADEGGKVVDAAQTAPDYLVAGDGAGSKPPVGLAKFQKQHPEVPILDPSDFYRLVVPTAEEFRTLMVTGPHGLERWNNMRDRLGRAGQTADLTGADFRNQHVEGFLYEVCLTGADFSGATIEADFDAIRGATFDNATFTEGYFTNAEDCSLKNATMNDVRWNPAQFARCDFSGARLAIRIGSYTTATDCKFPKADLHEARLEQSKFNGCDFRGANLQDAGLEECTFTDSNLSKADFTRADLRKVKFVSCDLRKAVFREALLTGANLSGAQIDGADFTGATVTNANLTGLDLSAARNLAPKATRKPGPKLRELGRAARASKRLSTSIEFALGPNESVTLSSQFWQSGTRAYPGAAYTHTKGNHGDGRSIEAPTFEEGMFGLIEMWSRGTPNFDSIKVDAVKCPVRGQELHELAVAAWYEAFEQPVPTAAEFAAKQQQTAKTTAALRTAMVAELHGGATGVAKWNKRPWSEREKLGKLRKHDFARAQLAKANLVRQNLEQSSFAGANLQQANFGEAGLKGVNFTGADLSSANLAGAKPADASFQGAKLAGANLRRVRFLRCNFQNADLSNANFSYSDVCGVDFTGANLAGAVYLRTKFNEQTIFPDGYAVPEELEWKGTGPRPGTAPPPPPPASGTLDFPTFLEQLQTRVEEARMKRVGSMLKAERFQLFADVTDALLTGVVKSQTDQDLVYSCRLAADGTFGCCTQNLRPCGGLRGALCKHLLVLIVGLAQAGELDAATVNHWIDLSRKQKPAIDEDSMSATFLRFKGAEAGELDWRPTETIPEDFYAM